MNLRVARNLIIVICLFSPFYYLSFNMLVNDLLPKTYIVGWWIPFSLWLTYFVGTTIALVACLRTTINDEW